MAWLDRQAWPEQQIRELMVSFTTLAAVFQAPAPRFSLAAQSQADMITIDDNGSVAQSLEVALAASGWIAP